MNRSIQMEKCDQCPIVFEGRFLFLLQLLSFSLSEINHTLKCGKVHLPNLLSGGHPLEKYLFILVETLKRHKIAGV